WGVAALSGKISEPAWRAKPSWYLIATEDKGIPPEAQHAMSKRAGSTVVEVKGSHAVYVSQPDAVAALIQEAAAGITAASRLVRASIELTSESRRRPCCTKSIRLSSVVVRLV
ncbi:MAG TPA: alpha/beta hydrolase, partial [Terriglobales bacterium]